MGARHNNKGSPSSVLLAGATGLIGGAVLTRLLADPSRTVLAPTRRPLAARPGLENPLLPLGPEVLAGRAVDVFVCALGTTLRRAGSRAAFRAVDVELVLDLARQARGAGARQAVVVSSVGAGARSSSFYLRCKGEMEAALAALGFDRVDILQPSLLLGAREENRPAEALGQRLLPMFSSLLRGRLAAYRPVSAEAVAARMVALIGAEAGGVYRHRLGVQGWVEGPA